MSKRARITLAPDAADVRDQAQNAAGTADTGTPIHETADDTDDSPVRAVSVTALPAAGTIIKALVAGLAVVSLVLLWKHRRS